MSHYTLSSYTPQPPIPRLTGRLLKSLSHLPLLIPKYPFQSSYTSKALMPKKSPHQPVIFQAKTT